MPSSMKRHNLNKKPRVVNFTIWWIDYWLSSSSIVPFLIVVTSTLWFWFTLPLQFPCNWQEGGFQDKRNYQCLLVAVVKLEQFAISHQTSKHINVLRQQAVWPLTSLQQYYLLLGYVCFRATLNFAKCINAYKTWCNLVPWSVRCIFVWCQAAWKSTMSPRSFMLSTLSTLQYDEFVTGFQPARMCVLSLLLQGCKSCAAPSIAEIWAKMDQIHGTA